MSSKFTQNSSLIVAQNQLVQWINDAGMAESGRRAELLRKIIEVLLHQCSHMLPVYLENVLALASDKSTDVKKQVIGFIEELSKLHPDQLPKIIGQLRCLVLETVVAVQKRAIQAASIVYRNTLLWICKGTATLADMQHVWENITQLKLLVLNMIDNDNEGVRTHSIKFLEEVILLQTPGEGGGDDFSLDNLPSHLPFINRKALDEESEHIFKLLVKFHNSQHISSVNLMACMTTLCLLAKLRPKFMPRVIRALGDLHTTLPPTLTQSQVNSVRKHLKAQLVNLIKHPSSNDMLPSLTQLLLDIGMTTQEINKALPKEKRNKRLGEIKNGDTPAKRFRVDSPQNSQGSDSNSRSEFNVYDEDSQPVIAPAQPVITKQNVTEDSLFEGLNNVDNVVNLVTSTLVNCLPNEIPDGFLNAYQPIPNSGSKVQKRNLAKMLLALIKNEPIALVAPPPAAIQPSLSDISAKIPLLREDEEKATLKNAVAKLQESTKADKQQMESAVSKLMEETRAEHLKEEERKQKDKEKPVPPPTPGVPKLKQKVKLLKLQEITRPIPKDIKEKLVLQAVDRILRAEKEAAIGGAANIRAKFITIFASSYTPELRELVLNYILDDPAARIELAISWLYEEYAFMQGFSRHPVTLQPKVHEKHDQNYNQLLCSLITQICERGDPVMEGSKDMLLRKIFSECPIVTDEAVDYLKHLVTEDKVALLAMELLEEMCIMRPPRAHKVVAAILSHVLNENEDIREVALKSAVKIYTRCSESTRAVIEKHALLHLGFISLPNPPPELCDPRTGRGTWNDDLFKMCLNLVMALFPVNEELIVKVARVYGTAGSDAKRCVLRVIEGPVRAVAATGDLSPAFITLLDVCPPGSETLLTRLIHIYTEKSPPTPELVSKVRELYATRVSDVRFLIPVLTGLSKKEILAALPKFIKLNPMVVKEVFNKLLGLQSSHEDCSPVSPADLLVALHLIDPGKADLKYIIKATALCFAEKQTFTQDVLAAVLQRLTEEPDIPVLMMRTVLQALTLYPNLGQLVLTILTLLIKKEVWNNKVAWEGWVKCCERLIPRSVPLLASLNPRGIAACAQVPRLQRALAQHVAALPPAQRAALPPHVIHAATSQPSEEQQFAAPAPLPVPPPNPMEPLPPGMD